MKSATFKVAVVACLVFTLFGGSMVAYGAADQTGRGVRANVTESRTATAADEALLLDDTGTTPEQALLTLIDSINAADWENMYYNLTPYTVSCYEYVRSDLAFKAPQFTDFKVLQSRFIQLDNRKYAKVEVSYTLTQKDRATGEQVTITRNGDWWTVFTEDGIWKPEYAQGTPGGTLTADTVPDLDIVLDYRPQPSIHNVVIFSGNQ